MQTKQKAENPYPFAVTDEVKESIDPANPHDPVARQYYPSPEELNISPVERADPIGDEAHSPVKGIVHRYPDRVLLKPVHVCPVYCRFCFRREMVGPGSEALSPEELKTALAYIRNTPAVKEVILTGGDPFILSPRRLKEIMDELNGIAHVRMIRFHTRVPVANPSRVTPELAAALKSEKTVRVALHCNHAQELTPKVRAAADILLKAGLLLLSQSVLLRGVNDDAGTLETLFRSLTEMKITPYYLHHPDLAPGTGHFRLSLGEGQKVMNELEKRMSGSVLPRYVIDIPGGFGKVPVMSPWVERGANGYILTDRSGGRHTYPEV